MDDTSIFCNEGIISNTVNGITSTLQKESNLWANLLAATGGKLELQKCFYYVLSWKYNEEGDAFQETMADQELFADLIQVHDEVNNEAMAIQQKETSQAHKTLGAYKTISGNEADHIAFWQRRVRNSYIS